MGRRELRKKLKGSEYQKDKVRDPLPKKLANQST